jgi:hypothetical protein
MREYEEAIYRAAELVIDEYLAGGNRPMGDVIDVPFIAFVYDMDVDVVYEEIHNTVEEIRNAGV